MTAGDHDLWDGRDKEGSALVNFVKVFGLPYQSFVYNGVAFLIMYNSDNYGGLGEDQLSWVESELKKFNSGGVKSILVFTHEPLYHPSSGRVMGKVEPKLKDEANRLIDLFKNYGVKEVFAGDIHYFTRYAESESGLPMTTIGAVASLRNTQSPRYSVVTIYEDLSYQVEDLEI